jgi:hypothetical protein
LQLYIQRLQFTIPKTFLRELPFDENISAAWRRHHVLSSHTHCRRILRRSAAVKTNDFHRRLRLLQVLPISPTAKETKDPLENAKRLKASGSLTKLIAN